MAEMVATFVRVTTDKIDEQIFHWLARISTALGLDRSTIALSDAAEQTMRTTHCWARDGVHPIARGIDIRARLPRVASRVLAGETVVVAHAPDLAAEAHQDLELSYPIGRWSSVTIPLKVGTSIIGAVAFGAVSCERIWPARLIKRLHLAAEIFGSALDRKRAVDEIYRLHDALAQVSRVAMMGELTASLTHELNQPLGAILSNAQAARRMLAGNEADLSEINAILNDIVHDDARAVDIIRWVRTMLRGRQPEKTLVSIADVLGEVQRILGHDAMMKRIALKVEAAVSPPVLGHKTELVQALANLVLNAFDAVAENDAGERKVVMRTRIPRSGWLSVSVSDSGKGIAPQVMAGLFEPFVTTKTNGMGMGLAITRSIAERHGGELRIGETGTRGTTFELELPVDGGSK